MEWKEFIFKEKQKDYYKKLASFLREDYKNNKIFPIKEDIFNAFKTPLNNIKVVIIGQDPYINEGEAHGLSFSVKPGIKIPPSLKNIFKEIKSDLNIDIPNNGYLQHWSDQGVFLLNSVLTVRNGASGSHRGIGWETFTDSAISLLNNSERPIAFLLWGAYAKSKKAILTNSKHLILEAAHPSPFSCSNFFGCKHFSKTNAFLEKNDISPIDWEIPDID
jgi:uracil-DNA glycosylase